jgi:hypothetical protein
MNKYEKADANSAASGDDTLMSVGQNDTELYEQIAKSVTGKKKRKTKQ